MQRRIRLRHLSYQTERSYLAWLQRFHEDVKTTMTYTHAATRNRLGVRSPLDAGALHA